MQLSETSTTDAAISPSLIFEDLVDLDVALWEPRGDMVGAISLVAVESRMKETRSNEIVQILQAEECQIETCLAAAVVPGKARQGTAE